MTDGWDALVVGGGPAAALAAAELASQKLRTLLVHPPGALESSAPDDWLRADDRGLFGSGVPTGLPLDRRLVQRRWGFLDDGSSLFVEEQTPAGRSPELGWTVRRDRLASFLTDRARSLGAEAVAGVPQFSGAGGARDGRGSVRIDGTEHSPKTTIVCSPPGPEGPAPRTGEPEVERTAWAAFSIEPATLERRFGLSPGEGVAIDAVLGFVPPPTMARGFVLTHHDTLTVGVVVRGPSTVDADGVLERFRHHSAVHRWVGDASTVRRGSETRPIGGLPVLGGPGLLVAGEALGARFENGIVHDRLGLELKTARAAALAAATGGARPGRGNAVSEYRRALARLGVFEDLARSRAAQRRVEWNPRLYSVYPRLVTGVFHRMMTETGAPKESVRRAFDEVRRSSGVGRRELAMDLLRMGGSL